MKEGSESLWTVWAWVTELLMFGVVPSVMLLLNVFVICEMRRLSAEERQLSNSVRIVHQVNSRQVTENEEARHWCGTASQSLELKLSVVHESVVDS